MATELLKTPESTASQLGHPSEKQPGKRLKMDFARLFQNPLSYQLTVGIRLKNLTGGGVWMGVGMGTGGNEVRQDGGRQNWEKQLELGERLWEELET